VPPRAAAPRPPEDGFGDLNLPGGEQDMLAPLPGEPVGPAPETRAEGLTARQLRMARRVAQKHGIEAASDLEAVEELRRRGIDPFQRSALLELVQGEAEATGQADRQMQLPQTVRRGPLPPAAPLVDDGKRAAEIMRMQREIARRRRRRLLMLFARLWVFVFLPTALAGWYYYAKATPLYATRSEFVIQQADTQTASGMGSLFRGTQFATTQDSITVQSYLQSRDAMLRLDSDLGFKAHFSDPAIDPIQRLDPDASNEDAYKVFKRNVKIGYDPTEGIIKMEVIAADPALSQKFSEALIGYAEEQVDHMTTRLRADQMEGATESYEDAEAKVKEAQARVQELQEQLGVLDPLTESNVIMTQVNTFEMELRKKQLELDALLDNPTPNKARVDGARGDISRLEATIADLRSQLTEGSAESASLASVAGQLRIAEGELLNRQQLLTLSLQQLETARIEANRQTRYLELGVSPVAPDEPTYPRAFENTVVAFLIFSGIYLMLSLTASVLREQVSA
jgi:capsular polysaccharide transport system permease protein